MVYGSSIYTLYDSLTNLQLEGTPCIWKIDWVMFTSHLLNYQRVLFVKKVPFCMASKIEHDMQLGPLVNKPAAEFFGWNW